MGDFEDAYEKRFDVTSEWCLAINNIEYVRQSLIPFTSELGMEVLIEKLSESKTLSEAQRCRHTLETVIANSIDTVRNKIIELLETVVLKVCFFYLIFTFFKNINICHISLFLFTTFLYFNHFYIILI